MAIKTRLSTAIDMKTWEPKWGVDVNTGSGWARLVEGGEIYLTSVKEEAQKKRAEVRKRYREQSRDK